MPLSQPLLSLIAYLLLAIEGGIVSILIPLLIAPRVRGLFKEERFECGQTPPPYGRRRLAMQYYPFLLVFLVFDAASFILFMWVYVSRVYPIYSFLIFSTLLFLLLPPVLLVRKLAEDIRQWW